MLDLRLLLNQSPTIVDEKVDFSSVWLRKQSPYEIIMHHVSSLLEKFMDLKCFGSLLVKKVIFLLWKIAFCVEGNEWL